MKKLLFLYLSTLMTPASAEIVSPSIRSSTPIELNLSEKLANSKRRGLDRLRPFKTACSLSEAEVATQYPQFEHRSFDPKALDLPGFSLENLPILNSPGSIASEVPKLQAGAREKLELWKSTHACIGNIEETKNLIRETQIIVEEICQQKGLKALPEYEIFKRAKDQSLLTEASPNSQPSKPSDEPTIRVYSPDYVEFIAKDFAADEVIKAGNKADAKNGTVSNSNSVTGGVSGGGDLSVSPLGVGGGLHAGINAGLTRTESRTPPQKLDFDKIEKEAYDTAKKYPHMTGKPANYECTTDKCRNTSNNVWFSRAEAPHKMGCTPGQNCEIAPDYDEEAEINRCVEQGVYDYFEKRGRLTRDPDYEFMQKIETQSAEDMLKEGFCEEAHFGQQFCRDWQRKEFEERGAPWLSDQTKHDIEIKKELLKQGICDPKSFGLDFCQAYKNMRASEKAQDSSIQPENEEGKPSESSLDEWRESLRELRSFATNRDVEKQNKEAKTRYCRQLFESNQKRLSPKPLKELFSGSLGSQCAGATYDMSSLKNLGGQLTGVSSSGEVLSSKRLKGSTLGTLREAP